MGKTSDLSGILILVAEDDKANFFLISEMLCASMAKILHAWDGKEAIEIFQRNPDIDVILMDIRMPRMDGYDATAEIRKFNREVPIIAQTGYVLEADRQHALTMGFNDYLTKPLNEKDLVEAIKRSVGRNKNK